MSYHLIPLEIYLNHILKYVIKAPVKLLDWIKKDKLLFISLLENPNAVSYCLDPNEISFVINGQSVICGPNGASKILGNDSIVYLGYLSRNPSDEAMTFIRSVLESHIIGISDISWTSLAGNPNKEAIKILKEQYIRDCKITTDILLSDTDMIDKLNETRVKYFRIDWDKLSGNPTNDAINLLKSSPDRINWHILAGNSASEAIKLIKKNKDIINWEALSGNPSEEAIHILKENFNDVDLTRLASNPANWAVELLKYVIYGECIDINWSIISTDIKEIDMIKESISNIMEEMYINWDMLSTNENNEAIALLERAMADDKIELTEDGWFYLSSNPTDNAINILKNNKDKIDLTRLMRNQSKGAMELLHSIILEKKSNKTHKIKIKWPLLARNPFIFEIDYIKWDKVNMEFYNKYIYYN